MLFVFEVELVNWGWDDSIVFGVELVGIFLLVIELVFCVILVCGVILLLIFVFKVF